MHLKKFIELYFLLRAEHGAGAKGSPCSPGNRKVIKDGTRLSFTRYSEMSAECLCFYVKQCVWESKTVNISSHCLTISAFSCEKFMSDLVIKQVNLFPVNVKPVDVASAVKQGRQLYNILN